MVGVLLILPQFFIIFRFDGVFLVWMFLCLWIFICSGCGDKMWQSKMLGRHQSLGSLSPTKKGTKPTVYILG